MRKKSIDSQFVLISSSLIIFLLFVLSLSVSGETIYVDDSGSGDFSSIQEAINDANESDTIHIYSGTYDENILVNKSLEIIGDDMETTLIQGLQSASEHTVRITADSVSIKDLSISNELRQNQDFPCIFVDGATDFLLDTCTISDGERGILLQYAIDAEIRNCIINHNDQKGIKLYFSDNCLIHDNQINTNGDGMRLHGSDGNSIYKNSISNNGYGILVSSSVDNFFYENEFSSNSADNAEDTSADGSNNWDHNQKGNYWDDYQDYDSNGDGVGDNPYSISGGSHVDAFPLGIFLASAQEPVAYIDSINPMSATEGDTIQFQGHGVDEDGYILDWEWRSSLDGMIHSSSADFTTSSLSVGTHIIRFRVKDDDDQWSSYAESSLSIQQESTQNQAPSASIVTINPSEIMEGDEIYFHGFGSDSDGIITSYQWSSNKDGVLSTESTFSIDTLSIGTHTISFKVKDDGEIWSSVQTAEVTVLENESINIKPVAKVIVSDEGVVNSSILFDASESSDIDGDLLTDFSWDFGDDSSGSGETISHKYSEPGNYTVTLTVTDENGGSSTDTTIISITKEGSSEDSNSNGIAPPPEEPDGEPDTPGFELLIFFGSIFCYVFFSKKRFSA